MEQLINLMTGWGLSVTMAWAIFIVLMIWTLVWKGLALWRAVEVKAKWWFIVFLVVNSLGILEIIYLFFLAPKKEGLS